VGALINRRSRLRIGRYCSTSSDRIATVDRLIVDLWCFAVSIDLD
jgi:hypothetical protein